jgi:molybdopterin/thiamine biosynthesis adenylyltransferase
MSTDSRWLEFRAPGFPPRQHPAEADLFARQSSMPGHRQDAIERAHVLVIGCGGLGSWIAVGLARVGVGHLTLVDPDLFDRTNAPRQLTFAADIGQPKAHSLAQNILAHMTTAGRVDALQAGSDEALATIVSRPDSIIVGVDNNAARLEAAIWARTHRVPAIFVMLSRDGLRVQTLTQTSEGPCLRCLLPNLDADLAAPCAAASIAGCYLAAAHAIEMTAAVLMAQYGIPTWRETSLDGTTERVGVPSRRQTCSCGGADSAMP